ncbi:MAG: hypothetical protein LQ346_004910, partial [Caloplaca aetnensis]
MPSINTQFSLGLELTRLIPLNLAASKAAEYIMSLARDLHSSGSDIVIEEDLALIFGRFQIAPELASSFKTIVVRTNSSFSLTEGISLISGAGPTVSRALLTHDNPAYFATVVQCSFLASIHDKSSLSTSIVYSMEKEREDAPSQHISRAVPNQQGVSGVLRACEEQTADFPWVSLVEAVARQLDVPDFNAVTAIPSAVLRGALYLFPMVQRVKDEYEAVIHLQSHGLCPLVVWAHRILGLDVLVRQTRDVHRGNIVETMFGRGAPNIIIEENLVKDVTIGPTMTLLVPATKETLFTFAPDPDEASIDAYSKAPVRGYGRRQLEVLWSRYVGGFGDLVVGKEAVMKELQLMVAGLGLHIANSLYKAAEKPKMDDPRTENAFHGSPIDIDRSLSPSEEQCFTDPQRFLEATRLLFDEKGIKGDEIQKLAAMYTGSSLHYLRPPLVLQTVSEKYGYSLASWNHIMLRTIRNLALVLLALSHVTDLDAAASAPLNDDIDLVDTHSISSQLRFWDEGKALTAPDTAWFEVFACLMIGHITEVSDEQLERTSLVSDRGWSLFINTHGIADSSFIDPGYVYIKFGVPCRNGVYKHRIMDAPISPFSAQKEATSSPVTGPGNSISLSAGNNPTFGSSYLGERGDTFIVSIRIAMQVNDHSIVRRTGYRELFAGA